MFRAVGKLYFILFDFIVLQADLFRSAVLYDDAFIQQRNMFAELCGFLHIVGGEENSHSFIPEFLQQLMDLAGSGRIQTACRFVEKENLWPVENGSCQNQPLSLSPGESGGRLFSMFIKSDPLQKRVYVLKRCIQQPCKILQVVIDAHSFVYS